MMVGSGDGQGRYCDLSKVEKKDVVKKERYPLLSIKMKARRKKYKDLKLLLKCDHHTPHPLRVHFKACL